MSIQINLGQWKSVFAVPSSVVDQHIKIASESQLKVLLYLLRHSDENNSAEQIGDTLRLSAEEVQNAVDFWIERDLLTQQNNGLAPASAPQPRGPPSTVMGERPRQTSRFRASKVFASGACCACVSFSSRRMASKSLSHILPF